MKDFRRWRSMRVYGMRTGIAFSLSASDHSHLTEVAADRNSSQKHVWRARIVLLSAQGDGTTEIMRATGKAETCVWRWQQRFMEAAMACGRIRYGNGRRKPAPGARPNPARLAS